MPEGSSSEAPVIRPGPNTCRSFGRSGSLTEPSGLGGSLSKEWLIEVRSVESADRNLAAAAKHRLSAAPSLFHDEDEHAFGLVAIFSFHVPLDFVGAGRGLRIEGHQDNPLTLRVEGQRT